MRFYDVDSGEITLDHKPIKDLTRRSLRLNYSMVLQDTWLFTGTVYENIEMCIRDRRGAVFSARVFTRGRGVGGSFGE